MPDDSIVKMNRFRRHSHRILLLFFTVFVEFSPAVPVAEKEILLQFKGNITSDPYKSLRSWSLDGYVCEDFSGVFCDSAGNVAKIVLWNTSLSGALSPALSGLKSLRTISLFGNRFSGNIPPEYGDIDSLWKINLSSNALSGSIPEFLGDLPNIRFLDLSRNGYSGEIPSALFMNCYRTKFISLSHNNLSGPIPPSISNCSNLVGIDLSCNSLNGEFPEQVCENPGLIYLSLRNNSLTGTVQEQLSLCKSLEILDISNNFFTGFAPFYLLQLSNLSHFNVSRNGFRGAIQEIENCSPKLEIFDVSGNQLEGKIPLSINRCGSLKFLDLGFNRINGGIIVEITDLKGLRAIRLANNSINGSIPPELGRIEYLEVLDLHNLNLVGEIPEQISYCRFLLVLDLSGNDLNGEIPLNLYNMSNLVVLDLHHNQINGNIPQNLGNLTEIQLLDLSENSLSGSIPFSLENLPNLVKFNLSHNNLSGQIPPKIQHFGFFSFFQNQLLCGPPLTNSCSNNSQIQSRTRPRLRFPTIIAIIAAALILIGVCLITIINMKARKRRIKEEGEEEEEETIVESTQMGSSESNIIIGKLVLFNKFLPSKYEDWEAGTKALLNKEGYIGKGTIGRVYRTNFENGVSIAVKKIEKLGRIKNQDEFEHEIGRLGSLRHPNLVAYQGYYWSSNLKLILCEFILNGNLYDNLHGSKYHPSTSTNGGYNSNLTWPMRFKIALGAARGLAYLHHDCRPPVLHLNLKSSNILLDENYEPKLADFGLDKFIPILDSDILTKFHNSVGYVAPELAQSTRGISDKCDVFSFGIVLLELVTGRRPVESPSVSEVVVLPEFVRGMIERGAAGGCLEAGLRGSVESEAMQVMKLGLICTYELPSRRPSMAEVVQVLESIRNGLG